LLRLSHLSHWVTQLQIGFSMSPEGTIARFSEYYARIIGRRRRVAEHRCQGPAGRHRITGHASRGTQWLAPKADSQLLIEE
jgi:hypothetical protein